MTLIEVNINIITYEQFSSIHFRNFKGLYLWLKKIICMAVIIIIIHYPRMIFQGFIRALFSDLITMTYLYLLNLCHQFLHLLLNTPHLTVEGTNVLA